MTLKILKINSHVIFLAIVFSINVSALLEAFRQDSSSTSASTDQFSLEWTRETKESLRKNIIGKCNWTVSSKLALSETHDLTVSFNFPSKREVRAYSSIPSTITMGNPKIVPILNCTRMRNWASEKGERWMVAADHPGQDRAMCMDITTQLGNGKILSLYGGYRNIQRTSYLIRSRNALIDHSGAVMFQCGYYHGSEIWELRWEYAPNWEKKCRKTQQVYYTDQGKSWKDLLADMAEGTNKALLETCGYKKKHAPFYKKVFVISASLDSNFHHLMTDSLARLPRFLGYLRKNPDIMIHIRTWEDYEPMRRPDHENFVARRSRELLLELLGIPRSRLITSSVTAGIVFIPRAMSWADSLKNPAEVRALARELLIAAKADVKVRKETPLDANKPPMYDLKTLFPGLNIEPTLYHQIYHGNYDPNKKNLVILVRAGLRTGGWGDRHWSFETYRSLENQIKVQFPDHNIVPHLSNSIYHPDFCMSCEINEISTADILIGLHGAGMTKQMFMPPNGIVFEITSHLNDAGMPLCGYYGNMAAMFGHHHYLYAYDFDGGDGPREPMNSTDVVNKLVEFHRYIRSDESLPLRQPKPITNEITYTASNWCKDHWCKP